MAILHHYPLHPSSRFARLQFGEYGIEVSLHTRVPWDVTSELLALNPAGSLPVFEDEDEGCVPGARVMCEWIEDVYEGAYLMPSSAAERAEVRRIIDWFEVKFASEVSEPLFRERVFKHFEKNQPISSQNLRQAISNAHVHMGYINFLAGQEAWLAGRTISLADMAAAAHLSVLDYFGDIKWDDFPDAKTWYMKMKSRPAFRPLLADVVVGLAPSAHYAVIDF